MGHGGLGVGLVEPSETVEEALRRDVLEEVGIRAGAAWFAPDGLPDAPAPVRIARRLIDDSPYRSGVR